MAVKFTKVCGSNRPRTKLDFGRVTKKVTKISDPGGCVIFCARVTQNFHGTLRYY